MTQGRRPAQMEQIQFDFEDLKDSKGRRAKRSLNPLVDQYVTRWDLNDRQVADLAGCTSQAINYRRRTLLTQMARAGMEIPERWAHKAVPAVKMGPRVAYDPAPIMALLDEGYTTECIAGMLSVPVRHVDITRKHNPDMASAWMTAAARRTYALTDEEKSKVDAMMVEGIPLVTMCRIMGIGGKRLGRYVRAQGERHEAWLAKGRHRVGRTLSEAAAARRRRLVPVKALAMPQYGPTPSSDPLHARISQIVGRGLTNDISDDMVQELYLAILEGRVSIEAVKEHVATVRNSQLRIAIGRFKDVSADRVLEGGASWIDLQADPFSMTEDDILERIDREREYGL
jgi:hypothetical protein